MLTQRAVAGAAPQLRGLEVSVAFVSPVISKKLNRTLRQKDSPADVISFALHRAPRGTLVGQIILCPRCMAARRKISGRSLEQETAALFLHGLLHVLGYDHRRPAPARIMEQLERRILSS